MEAFEDIVKDYSQQLYYFLRNAGLSHDETDELLEDVFIAYWRDLRSGHGLEAVSLRLFKHATRQVLERWGISLKEPSAEPALRDQLVLLLKQQGFDSLDVADLTGMTVAEVRESYRAALGSDDDIESEI